LLFVLGFPSLQRIQQLQGFVELEEQDEAETRRGEINLLTETG
jgi:hypothetical protein